MSTADTTSSDEVVKEINVLLLGESGVGKSTFINSCVNYLTYKNLNEAVDNELKVLIPAKFSISDEEGAYHQVLVGDNKDQNEVLQDGKAATQNVKTYIFPCIIDDKKYKIRLLDTPGMADERGIEQDQRNCELILAYLSQMKEIHAFCILLKPTNSRLDVFMNYCIVQILSRLEKSAVNNVMFIFTNTRGQNFTPGETHTPLKVLINKIRDNNKIAIPFSKENQFCFDNESFKYVAAVQNRIELSEIAELGAELSWKMSSKEFWRLMTYVTQIEPHDLKRTMSVNEARAIASHLLQPITEILQLIGDNIRKLHQHSEELSKVKLTKQELEQKMYTPRIDFKVNTLKSPRTVCTSRYCTKDYMVNGIRKVHYKTICCEGCKSITVSAEMVGKVGWCSKFGFLGFGETCSYCEHPRDLHMHIYYETDVFEKKMDETLLPEVNSQEELLKAKEKQIEALEILQNEYELERLCILQACVTFDMFLKQRSVTPIGDPVHDYLKYQIVREQSYGSYESHETVNSLRKILADYEYVKELIKKEMPVEERDISPDDIEKIKKKMLNLKHFGSRIQELYDKHVSGSKQNFEKRETEVGTWFKSGLKKVKKGLGKAAKGVGNAAHSTYQWVVGTEETNN